ncbi:hypothetical protein [Streptococcus hyointestinalis]|uniref:hypothetical protein n=1 Tax=Streptococcus hyointestinalis TaxID=1337 RepID=UPI001F14EB55|nr:hypothetical protein [Streptococcus hyointestinalis]
MAKLAIMSALHIALNPFGQSDTECLRELLREDHLEPLLLAGVNAIDFHQPALPFIRVLQKYLPVTYNLGNPAMRLL